MRPAIETAIETLTCQHFWGACFAHEARTCIIVVDCLGNKNGFVGIGRAKGKEVGPTIRKAIDIAKLNIIEIKRGCGSWECGCGGDHSIPFKSTAKSGSITVRLLPAPKGTGIVADDTTKKMLKLAGLKDVWVKTDGQTSTRGNLASAVFQALKNLNRTKGDL